MTEPIIPIRLSHSSLDTLHSCERKWQLEKLLVDPSVREESEHTVFGRALGAGVATYMVTQDIEQAIYQLWLAYWPELESDKKSIVHCIAALQSAVQHCDTLLMEYEVATFKDGKPAVELSYRLDINENYYFVGYIDLVLRNRFTGIYSVFDVKSTGLQLLDLSPLYQNSGQVLGYSVAIDKIVGEQQASYGIGYIACQINAAKYTSKTHIFYWEKSLLDRLNWFMTLGLDVKHLEMMAQMNYYPRRGDSCLKYNKPCRYFGTCQLHSLDIPRKREVDTIEYDFRYDLEDLIQDHIARLPQEEVTA